MRIRYVLNGVDVNPVKREDIYFEINHDQGAIINQGHPNVGIGNLYFAREDIAQVMTQLDTAPGITEGAPFDVIITEGGTTETINFFLNFMDGFKRSNDGIVASIKLLQGLDWLDFRVQSFTFESMYNEGVGGTLGGSVGFTPITVDGIYYSSYQQYMDKRAIFIPYVISTIPNFQTAFMASFALVSMADMIYKCIKQLLQWSAPSVGLGVVVHILQLVLEVVYAILLVLAIIVLIEELIAALIQPLKYHAGMLVVDLLKLVAAKVGLTLQSSIWTTYPYNQVAYLPEKFNPIEDSQPSRNVFGNAFNGFAAKGFTSPGYAIGTAHDSTFSNIQKGYFNGDGGEFLRLVKTFCNGKFIIPDSTTDLVLERRDYYPPTATFQLPPIRQDWNGYNTDEMSATIILEFATDLNDKNCLDFIPVTGAPFYQGTILQATAQQTVTVDILKVGLTGLRTIQINAARGACKDKLNFIEDAIAVLETIWNDVIVAADAVVNAAIDAMNVAIGILNVFIDIWNDIIAAINDIINFVNTVIQDIVGVINDIIDAIDDLPFINIGEITARTIGYIGGTLTPIATVHHVTLQQPFPSAFGLRIGALLLENDIVSTPKLLMVDTARTDFTASGGYSGQKRIAYLMQNTNAINNQNLINAQKLWTDFYYIDSFVDAFSGATNNRFTKIAPACNHVEDNNPTTMRLADFKELVNNPQFKDNFGENVIAESIQWYLEKNGKALVNFRKAGWLRDPQNNNGTIRAQEININLNLAVSLPTGQ